VVYTYVNTYITQCAAIDDNAAERHICATDGDYPHPPCDLRMPPGGKIERGGGIEPATIKDGTVFRVGGEDAALTGTTDITDGAASPSRRGVI
jgi:hypothetical protein